MKTFAQKQARKPVATLGMKPGLKRREHPVRLWPAAAPDTGIAKQAAERGGAPLPKDVRSHFEPRFGADLSRIQAQAPGVISRQTATPDKEGKPRDLKKLLKEPCFGENVDDARARCQFSNHQLIFVRIIKEHALRKCAKAITAINMPGNEGSVKKKAREYFHLDIKLSEKTKRTLVKTITAISDKLKDTPIECGTCQDEGCNRGFIAYVPPGKASLVLCPKFFMDEIHKLHLTPRTLIHEAGHLAGVNTPSRDELYCHEGKVTEDDKCPVVNAIRNADAWAHFIDELSYTV